MYYIHPELRIGDCPGRESEQRGTNGAQQGGAGKGALALGFTCQLKNVSPVGLKPTVYTR